MWRTGVDGFLASRGMGGTPRGRNRAAPRCSKGSSGEAIPCQPKPLTRRHRARVALDRQGHGFLSDLTDWYRMEVGHLVHWCPQRGAAHPNRGIGKIARRPLLGTTLNRAAGQESLQSAPVRHAGSCHHHFGNLTRMRQSHPDPMLPRFGWA